MVVQVARGVREFFAREYDLLKREAELGPEATPGAIRWSVANQIFQSYWPAGLVAVSLVGLSRRGYSETGWFICQETFLIALALLLRTRRWRRDREEGNPPGWRFPGWGEVAAWISFFLFLAFDCTVLRPEDRGWILAAGAWFGFGFLLDIWSSRTLREKNP